MTDIIHNNHNHSKISEHPVVLAISGLDPTGSAGLIADIRVLQTLGCHPCGVVTCETVQNSSGLTGLRPSEPQLFTEQILSILEDIHVCTVKIGAVNSIAIIEALGAILHTIPDIPVVLDPVLAPTYGQGFLNDDGIFALGDKILEHTLIATPNILELGALAGIHADSLSDSIILEMSSAWFGAGVQAILVTGIVRDGQVIDRLIRVGSETDVKVDDFTHPELHVGEVHGTGCVLSSAIAGYLSKGEKLKNAVKLSVDFTLEVIANSVQIGGGSRFWK